VGADHALVASAGKLGNAQLHETCMDVPAKGWQNVDLGVDVVGGSPHFERTMADGAASVRALCEIAASRGLMVDMHCDETDDPMSRHVETLAAETVRLGLHGRVTGSHLTSMHSMDNYYVSKLLDLMTEARLNVIANPLINIYSRAP
jgi:cytosine/creatinine deaminase